MYAYIPQLLITAILLVGFVITKRAVSILFERLGAIKQVPKIRITNILHYLNALLYLALALLLMMVWGIDYRGLLLFASSVLAVIGVALVAQWSILSNITAGVIIFFSFPARIGDTVEIIDGGNKMQGEITDINLFQIVLKDKDGQTVAYPNNLILQRPVIKIIEKPTEKTELSTFSSRLKDRV